MSTRRAMLGGLVAIAGLGALSVPNVAAKRAAPPTLKPLVVENTEYRAAYRRLERNGAPTGMQAMLEARVVTTKRLLWRVPLYEVKYQPGKETDVQDVFVSRLSPQLPGILAETEHKKAYLVSPDGNNVRELPPAGDRLIDAPEDPDVARKLIADGRGNRETCHVHEQPLGEDVVTLRYGMVRYSDDAFKARFELFPHAKPVYDAGCRVGPARWAVVRYCPECRSGLEAFYKARQ